ncbi:FxsA family protein [Kineococcus sp. SYSU DK003]|uniref:FxsA family protein n=1 Tax=Kineococcus sp. SYSU DK003 TaxID=3383124 RepID=UPI003D7ECEC9
MSFPVAPGPRARRWTAWLPVGLLLLVVVEVWLLVQLGHVVGGGWVFVLLVVETFGGALVLRRAGRRAVEAFRQTASVPFGAPVPGQEPGVVGNAVLTGVGGALLVVPGLLSDVAGLLCIFPPTRRLIRRVFVRLARQRFERAVREAGGTTVIVGDVVRGDHAGGHGGDVVDGEVVEDPRELGR